MKSQENNYDAIKNHFYGTLGFIQLLDMRITELSEGYCKGEMPLRPEILNPLGSVHGGCTFALADTIGGSAALTHGNSVMTVDSNIHYLAPARNTEKLVAEAKEIKYGSTIAVYEVNVYKADGTMVATSIQSYFVFSDKNKKDKS
ncbi:MAG: PaaI family thioesterase [Lachnospiraceae bacterium]|nr:PaaI family thioesterase [Lachnospiraceae bacterium]